jgi:DNA polymerase
MDYRGVKFIATFHPAYLLRNPNEKRRVWEDMKIIRAYIASLND